MSGPTWVYGVTTVPERREKELARTLASLKNGGFPQPLLFVDGEDETGWWKTKYGLRTIGRFPRIGAWGNWFLAINEMYIRNPAAGRYVLFQDDIVVMKNLRQYLERISFPGRSYWNLITYPKNYELAKKDVLGFYPASSKTRGLGAQGLVFDRQGVLTLLTSAMTHSRPQDEKRGKINVDGGIVDAMNKAGYKELVHNPSLIKHINGSSIIGHGPQPEATSFLGENADAMNLEEMVKRNRVWPWGDVVSKALSTIGVTPERVSEWIGADCGCKERRQRLNELGDWSGKVINGAISNAKERLEGLVGKKL